VDASAAVSRAIPGSGPELLPIARVDEVVEHHPDACRRCGSLLEGEDPDPLRHQVIEILPITPLVIEHRLHRLVCPCCSTSTRATLPADVEASHYGPRLSSAEGPGISASPSDLRNSATARALSCQKSKSVLSAFIFMGYGSAVFVIAAFECMLMIMGA
jgi:hypothetical protein